MTKIKDVSKDTEKTEELLRPESGVKKLKKTEAVTKYINAKLCYYSWFIRLVKNKKFIEVYFVALQLGTSQ